MRRSSLNEKRVQPFHLMHSSAIMQKQLTSLPLHLRATCIYFIWGTKSCFLSFVPERGIVRYNGGYESLKSLLSPYGRPSAISCSLCRLLSHPGGLAFPFLTPLPCPFLWMHVYLMLFPFPSPSLLWCGSEHSYQKRQLLGLCGEGVIGKVIVLKIWGLDTPSHDSERRCRGKELLKPPWG